MKISTAMLCALLLSTCQFVSATEEAVATSEDAEKRPETLWKEKPKSGSDGVPQVAEENKQPESVTVEKKADKDEQRISNIDEEKPAPEPGKESDQTVLEWLENWLSEHNAKKREEKAAEAAKEEEENTPDPS